LAPEGSVEWVVTKTYAVEDKKTGQRGSFSVTFTTDLVHQGDDKGFPTLTGMKSMELWHDNDFLKTRGDSSFSKAFLPPLKNIIDPIWAFFLGKGIVQNAPDGSGLEQQRLVYAGFF
jgi:hypothetical protein